MDLKKREPTVLAGLVMALFPAVFAVLSAFNVWEPTPEQMAALMGLYVALIAVVMYVLRGIVWSPASVASLQAKTASAVEYTTSSAAGGKVTYSTQPNAYTVTSGTTNYASPPPPEDSEGQ